MNLNVRHLDGCTSDGLHPTKSIARSTRMVQRGKTFERWLQTGYHLQIGTKATRGDNHRLCLECISAAVGVLRLHTRHTPIDSREQTCHFVRCAYLDILIGCRCLKNLHQMRADSRTTLRAMSALHTAATHQSHITQIGTQSCQPRNGHWGMLHQILYQRRDILVFPAFHCVVIEQFLTVLNAETLLDIRLCRIDTARRVVSVTTDDALLLQYNDLQTSIRFCCRHSSR